MFCKERTQRRGNSKTTVADESAMQLMDVVAKRVQPYLKLARFEWSLFGGWLLVLWPFFWGAALATENGALPDWRILTVLTVAAKILCSAGCTINDLWDKDFDGKVERSKLRPLVTGEVTPFQAWIFFGALNLFYVAILSQLEVFSLSSQFKVLIAIQLIINILYPLSKRWTHWTPAVLGVGINWGMLLGWSAIRGPLALGPPTLPLASIFFAAWCWVLMYETIYAHQDLKDDMHIGIKSMAILLGNDTKLWLSGFAIAFLVSLSIVGYIAPFGRPFYIGIVATAIHVGWQIATVDLKNSIDCLAKYKNNKGNLLIESPFKCLFGSLARRGAFVFGGMASAKLLT